MLAPNLSTRAQGRGCEAVRELVSREYESGRPASEARQDRRRGFTPRRPAGTLVFAPVLNRPFSTATPHTRGRMRFLALLIPCVPLLAGCHKADARANTEMAQCMAAMGLEHGYLLYQTPPRYDLLAPLTAGITWYKHKLRVAGVPDQG